jgi:hypothetical protein
MRHSVQDTTRQLEQGDGGEREKGGGQAAQPAIDAAARRVGSYSSVETTDQRNGVYWDARRRNTDGSRWGPAATG